MKKNGHEVSANGTVEKPSLVKDVDTVRKYEYFF